MRIDNSEVEEYSGDISEGSFSVDYIRENKSLPFVRIYHDNSLIIENISIKGTGENDCYYLFPVQSERTHWTEDHSDYKIFYLIPSEGIAMSHKRIFERNTEEKCTIMERIHEEIFDDYPSKMVVLGNINVIANTKMQNIKNKFPWLYKMLYSLRVNELYKKIIKKG